MCSSDLLTFNSSTNSVDWQSQAGGFTSFDVAGDSGPTQTITNSNTLTIIGGNDIDTVASATDNLTIDLEPVLDIVTTINLAGTASSITGSTAVINFTDFDVASDGGITAENSTANHVFGSAASFEIVNSTGPTTDTAGEIALDTNGDGSNVTTGVLQTYDGTETLYIFGTTAYPTADGNVLTFNSSNNSVDWQTPEIGRAHV